MKKDVKTKPRRSALYTPGGNVRALEKIARTEADVFIIDLEDAVAPEGKDEARRNVAQFLQAWAADGREVVVRVNALDSGWCAGDLRMLQGLRVDGLLFPKINDSLEVDRAHALLTEAGIDGDVPLWCTIETPLAILNLHAIARTAQTGDSRLSAWVMGANDLAKETGMQLDSERTPMLYALSASVIAARAYGLSILDAVHNDIADTEGLARVCAQGRALGFDGKTLIHPSQIALCNEVFSPTAVDVDFARRVVAEFERPENAGKGVLKLDGKMVELLHAQMARRTIALAEAISARAGGASR